MQLRVISGVISGSCHGHVRVMSGSFQGDVKVMSGSCQGHGRDLRHSSKHQSIYLLARPFLEHCIVLYNRLGLNLWLRGSCQGHFRVMSGSCQGHARVISRSCQGHAGVISGSLQGHFRVMEVGLKFDPTMGPASLDSHFHQLLPLSTGLFAVLLNGMCCEVFGSLLGDSTTF